MPPIFAIPEPNLQADPTPGATLVGLRLEPANPDPLAIGLAWLHPNGRILHANSAWNYWAGRLARPEYRIGEDYLAGRQQAARAGEAVAEREWQGVLAVATGQHQHFEMTWMAGLQVQDQQLLLKAAGVPASDGMVLLELMPSPGTTGTADSVPVPASPAWQWAEAAMHQMGEACFWVDAEGRFQNVNPSACRQTGYSRGELLGRRVSDLARNIAAELWPLHWAEIKRRGTLNLESEFLRPTGTGYAVELSLHHLVVGGQEQALIVARDNTHRKLVEDEMFRANEMLRVVLDSIPIRVAWKDTQLAYQGGNRAFWQGAGFATPGEFMGCTDEEMPWKSAADFHRADDLGVMSSGQPKLNFEEFAPGADGTVRWFNTSKVPLCDRQGRATGVLGVSVDITERKQLDKLLQQQARSNAVEAEVGLALSENTSLAVSLQRCAEALARHPWTALAGIWRPHPASGPPELMAAAGRSGLGEDGYATLTQATGLVDQVFQSAQLVVTQDLARDPLAADATWAQTKGLRAFAGLPLLADQQVAGVLALFSQHTLPEAMIKLLGTVARALAQVIARHRAEQALRQSEARLQTLFRASPVGVCILRPETGRLLDVNEGMAAIFGLSRAALLARPVPELDLGVDPADQEHLLQTVRQQPGLRLRDFRLRFRRPDGAPGTLLVAAESIQLEGQNHWLGIVSDVTEQEHRNEELRRARDAAEVANRAKSTFLANMSHEIRTPMNAILGYAQLMQRDPGLPAASREKLAIINRSGQHLLALIEDVLEMSKIEAGRVTVQPVLFDLSGMLDDLAAMFRLRTEAKGLTFNVVRETPLPHGILADEGRFRQILVNLLGNAVKFTVRGGVELRVGVAGQAGQPSRLSARVCDTGPGIAPEDLGRLFRQFEQTGAQRHFNEGTGLGLAISREYARLMGGDITVASQPGQGSCFHLEIPVSRGPEPAAGEPVRPARVLGLRPGQAPVTVLVADDNPPNRNWVKQLLLLVGCQVVEAANGFEAVERWEQWRPRLVLMDLQMPGLDGYAATRQIKARPGSADTVILAVTAAVLEESRRGILAAGAADLLGKPMEEGKLFEKMATWLGVEFVYESAAETAAIPPADDATAAIARLPADLRRSLREAIANGDLAAFTHQLAEVAGAEPGLARMLQPLADNYDYDRLLAWLN